MEEWNTGILGMLAGEFEMADEAKPLISYKR